MKTLVFVSLASMLLSGCYTLKQGYYQTRLLLKRESIEDVLNEKKETSERLDKLKLVPVVLKFAHETLGLEIGDSYRQYIPLDQSSVTFVVQAAERRSLKMKTWWFPIVGSQPYLGFFKKEDAVAFQKEMHDKGFDTSMGGVDAFSLLGFFPDPIYSSMIDGKGFLEIAELLFHECTHRTLYIPNHASFNENLADFVARKAAPLFFDAHKEYAADVSKLDEAYRRRAVAGERFREYLKKAKAELDEFYARAASDETLKEDDAFLAARQKKFTQIAAGYKTYMNGLEKDTPYQWYFREGHINNAVILGYSLYQAKQDPFEAPFALAGQNVKEFLSRLKVCLEKKEKVTEDELWNATEHCGESR